MSLVNDDDAGHAGHGLGDPLQADSLPPAMGAPKDRRAVNAFLTEEARDGWTRYAQEHGVTLSALLEVLGLRLKQGEDAALDAAAVETAREIDAARRARRRK